MSQFDLGSNIKNKHDDIGQLRIFQSELHQEKNQGDTKSVQTLKIYKNTLKFMALLSPYFFFIYPR